VRSRFCNLLLLLFTAHAHCSSLPLPLPLLFLLSPPGAVTESFSCFEAELLNNACGKIPP
jgi:hypothetical protein